MPAEYVVDSVVVVVAGAVVVVCSVVVVLVCANANGAIAAQANPIIIFFMVFPFIVLSLFDWSRVENIRTEKRRRTDYLGGGINSDH